MKLDSLENLFLHELKDLLSAEKQLVRALPKMAKGANSDKLKAAFEEHLEQTKVHVTRLEEILEAEGKPARAEHCKAMEGLVAEGSDLLDEDGTETVKDAALIGAAQRVEHYEIAAYGTTRTLAEALGKKSAVKLLQQTLDEEKETDEKLTQIAITGLASVSQVSGDVGLSITFAGQVSGRPRRSKRGRFCSWPQPGLVPHGLNNSGAMMTTTRRKKASKSKSRSKFRASWRGQLRFGLVAFGVQAINAEIKEKGEIHFHLLHAPDHKRIHYAKICPTHGEVPNDEIVEGYEYGKDRYVEFEKDELDALRTDREKALTVDSFISPADLDPLYFDGRMYFLIPDGTDAAEPYTVVEEAMAKQDCWGVGQVVFSGREQLAVVRPVGGLLTMSMLSYQDEIRKPEDFHGEFARARTTPRKIKLAEDLIRNWTEKDFDFGEYHDRYRQKVKQLVDAKVQGREVVAPEEEEEPEVLNLMDALKQSVGQRTGESSYGARTHSKSKRSTTHGSRKRRA